MLTQWQRLAFYFSVTGALISSIDSCWAGAWLQPEGRTQIIFSNISSDAKQRFTRQQRRPSTDRFSKQHMIVTAERGWTENVSVLAGVQLQHASLTSPGSERHSIYGAGSFGLKARLWSTDHWVISTQATLQTGSERRFPRETRPMVAATEADLALNIGHNFSMLGWPAFVDVQTGYRWRGGGFADELRLDGTIGFRPMSRFLVMLQSFNTLALTKAAASNEGRFRQHKLQPSLVFELTQRWSVQIGAFAVVAGNNTVKERGGLAAMWWKF